MRRQRWIVAASLWVGLSTSACKDSEGTTLAEPCDNGVCPAGFVCSADYCIPVGGETGDTDETGELDETGEMDDTGDGDGDQACGSEWAEKDGETPSIMDKWGAPCVEDQDCVSLIGADAVCFTSIFGVYDLPGGFCSKICEISDLSISFEHDDPTCDPEGGVSCVGVQGVFTACMIPCDDHSQCGREGYGCRIMPSVAAPDDPTFCFMDPETCCSANGCRD